MCLLVEVANQISQLAWIFQSRYLHFLDVRLPSLAYEAVTAEVQWGVPGILGEHLL